MARKKKTAADYAEMLAEGKELSTDMLKAFGISMDQFLTYCQATEESQKKVIQFLINRHRKA